MKHSLSILITLSILCIGACKKQDCSEEQVSDCLQTKFEEFKQISYAHSIIKITRPDGTLYWFVDSFADGGEDVLNEDCEVVCIADCECDGSTIVFCDETHLSFPRETIWKK